MKKSILFFSIFFSTLFLIGCDEEKRFNGSPVGNLEIETLQGTITTPVTLALTDQLIPFTATLPRTFQDTVKVEATSISNSGRRIRAYVEILPNQLSGTGEIFAAGGALFNTTFDLSLTAIELNTVEKGKHYLMTSPVVPIQTGNTTIQDVDTNKLSVKLVWPNVSALNNLRFNIDKPGVLQDANVTSLPGSKTHFINVDNNGPNNNTSNSSAVGDYIFNISALTLITSPIDMPYRLVLVYPDGKEEVFDGVYPGLFVGAPLLPILKVKKETIDGKAVFSSMKL
jgi:hypothetical protein